MTDQQSSAVMIWLPSAYSSSAIAIIAVFYAEMLRGRRFKGRAEIEAYISASGLEATGYSYTAVDEEYAIVSMSMRRRLPSGGLADSTLAMVFKGEGDGGTQDGGEESVTIFDAPVICPPNC